MANWWDAAPVVNQTAKPEPAAPAGNWWDSAPVANQQAQPTPQSSDPWVEEEAKASMPYVAAQQQQQEFHRPMLLPLARDPSSGNVEFTVPRVITGIPSTLAAIPSAIESLPETIPAMAKSAYEGLKSAVTAPGDAATGKLQVMGPDGNVTPEAIARATDFATAFSPMSPGLRAGEALAGGAAAFKTPELNVPTQQMLKDAAGKSYDALRDLKVDYHTSSVNDLSGEIGALLTKDGITPTLAPKTYSVLSGLAEAPAGSVASLDGLTAARRAFGHAASDFGNPTEQLAAKRATESLDGFLARSDPAAVANGPAEQVPGLLADARGNYAAAKRSETLTDLQRAVELRANAANSGANSGNTTRQRVASLLLNDKQSAGFNPEEIAALENVNKGSLAANATRRVGNMLAGGGGLGSSLLGLAGAGVGSLTGDPLWTTAGASLPLAGIASREASNALTERALTQVDQNVRKRSPLFEALIANTPKQAAIPTKQAVLIRALLLGSQDSSGGGGW